MSRLEVINWCPPLHHKLEGILDPDSYDLQDPFVAVIIGGSRGMGSHMAKSFTQAGASHVVITGRDAAALTQAQNQAQAAGKHPDLKVQTVVCDVLKEDEIRGLANQIRESVARIDCLIINSGTPVQLVKQEDGRIDWPKGIIDAHMSDLRHVMDLNLMAPMTVLHHLLPLVIKATDGPQTVVIVSSSAANNVDPKSIPIAYSMSKFANARLAEYIHEGYNDKGICSIAIQPGSVMTESAKSHVPTGKNWEAQLSDDVGLAGRLCVWLASEKRSWLSGRYIDSRWDLEELERRRPQIEEKDQLKFRLVL
ncbi:short chain dehydrogenase domain-containing protein [Sarocladium implicatum]|nr:short chain dehydrogenase domain-containing protein [Sarocladium implicatum]